MCKVIAHVEIEITADDKGGVSAVFTPTGKGTASYQHIVLHGMSQIVGGVVIQLTLVGGADEIILMGAGEGDAINLVPVLFRHIFPQIPVEKDNEETEEFKITFRGDYLFYLVHKYFFLKIK